jgi:hypothetical protein
VRKQVTEPLGEPSEQREAEPEPTDAGEPGGEGAVECGCEGPCDHAPRIEEYVLPSRRPAEVGVMPIDRDGLVELARRRGYQVLVR